MNKIRISVYVEQGKNNEKACFYRDDLVDIKEGIIDEEEDIKIEISRIEDNQIVIKANGSEFILKKEEKIQFDCCTGYYSAVSSDNQYFFIISWKTKDILNYEKTKYKIYHDYLKEELINE